MRSYEYVVVGSGPSAAAAAQEIVGNGKKVLIAKAYGGNKFMNSKRSQLFFDKIVFE